jgi:hypothetical protein
MIIHDCPQGTPEWAAVRLGIPTASRVGDILTPKTLKLSGSAGKYRNQLVAEWLCGHPIDWSDGAGWMERGRDMEAEARKWYAFSRDCDVRQVGFISRDDGLFGCSPDGLVGDDGGLELKCPALHTHVGYLLNPTDLAEQYRGQVQASLYVTGRAWWDLVSYSPDLPAVELRIEPDEDYIDALDMALAGFIGNLLDCRERLAEHKQLTPADFRAEMQGEAA